MKFENRDWVELENEGNKMYGVFHQPINGHQFPGVLLCHGLAGHKIGKHRMYVHISECLARVGIASLRIDLRGSGDSEGEFGTMSMKDWISDSVKALEFLAKQPQIDNNRIGVYGRSFGGPIAIFAAHQFGKVKSMVLWAPVFNARQWEELWELSETGKIDEEQRHELMRINGQLPSMQFYQDLFNMNLEREVLGLQNVPMLFIHGEQDPLISIDHTENYIGLRKGSPAETDFIRLPHSDHDFTHPEEKLRAINLTCQWFAKTL